MKKSFRYSLMILAFSGLLFSCAETDLEELNVDGPEFSSEDDKAADDNYPVVKLGK